MKIRLLVLVGCLLVPAGSAQDVEKDVDES